MIYIFEGIDRVGKDTLIEGVASELNEPINHHFSAPPQQMPDLQAQILQRQSYEAEWVFMRDVLADPYERDMIINRFHLGETVYGPRYRTLNSHGIDAIFNDERDGIDLLRYNGDYDNVRLVLVTTSSFAHLVDDGGNFNWENKELEQNDFLRAWARSGLKKKIIDTYDPAKNYYRDIDDLVNEAMAPSGWYTTL